MRRRLDMGRQDPHHHDPPSRPRCRRRAMPSSLCGGGTFADAVALQKAMISAGPTASSQAADEVEALRVVGIGGQQKPPRVIRMTEEVEQQLTAAINSPNRIGSSPPDFEAMRQRVLHALTDKPFESDRRIPYADSTRRRHEADRKRHVHGRRDQPDRSTLRGADLPPWLFNPLR